MWPFKTSHYDVYTQFRSKYAWDYDWDIYFTENPYIIRNEVVGAVLDDHKGMLTRESVFIVSVQTTPDAMSVQKKNEFMVASHERLKMDLGIFLRDYIKTYYPDPLDFFIYIESLEFAPRDPLTARSLNTSTVIAKMIESKPSKVK